MTATDDEEAIIRQCQQGDVRGLELLVVRHQVTALRLAFLLVGNADLAQDIVQESFLQAFRSIRQFHLGAAFAPWFHRIVMNLARQYLRDPRNKVERSLQQQLASNDGEVSQLIDPAPDPETIAEHHETRRTMLEALKALTLKQREVIILRYYLGYQDQEIALLLNCPNNTIRQRLYGARQALFTIIQERYAWLINNGWSLSKPSSIPTEET